jgi:PTS system nitrogen regulatory IIA component
MPNSLPYLSPDRVILPLVSSRKVDAIRELASLFQDSDSVTNFRTFLSALFRKEQRFGSAVEHGIALPHYRDDSIVEPIVSIGVAPDGIDWGNGDRVNILVLVGWPNKHQSAYLKTVAELASVLRLQSARSAVLKSKSSEDVIRTMREAISSGVAS